jgi:hypothetical protein
MTVADNQADPFKMFDGQKTELKLFSDELLSMKGKYLELYIGDQCMTLDYDEMSVPQNSSIFGKLIDVLDRFVVLECIYVQEGTLKRGNKIYINAFQIRAMTELDMNGSLQDIFLNVKDAQTVRKLMKIAAL